ncbi:MAG: ATP-binding cassette domain-containing protein [Spirochaetaceae bacterium]|jgi:ABC-type lipoprotein export system ATPase subunit|nr:ATP-binding cassette domain-containing protein [Spirochaetaceae bacterium]
MNAAQDPQGILRAPYRDALEAYPLLPEFFAAFSMDSPPPGDTRPLEEILAAQDEFTLGEFGIDKKSLPEQLALFIGAVRGREEAFALQSLTVLGGRDKGGNREIPELRFTAGEVVSIVGPTGSGKSRLLADIEWMAQGDTPTGRRILINDEVPPQEWRYWGERKLVAQLSQHMNFVMDLSVGAFIDMHGKSRMAKDLDYKKKRILEEANRLAGEPIGLETPVTALSGGQSRALMIADTAFLSPSPIVLIDEIENAGIDRRMAVELLIRKEKIVLIATHDPILALHAQRRIVIKNGGIFRVIETGEAERQYLGELEKMHRRLMECRERLRSGDPVA